MGMRAVTGAVSSLYWKEGKFEATVIGNTIPKGICGSALIDAVAIFRQQDLIGMFGEINSGEMQLPVVGKVVLTQKDINEFQLAKAAIAAGLTILCSQLSIKVSDISELYIAGGFGNYINLSHLTATGMIELPEEKIHKMGNTALIGAKLFLFTDDSVTHEILNRTSHINLESDPDFQDIYVEKLMFE
jgi:uncharacterized 2Fe-2S/4Fe-4S cluster protein (DUF4445 family)